MGVLRALSLVPLVLMCLGGCGSKTLSTEEKQRLQFAAQLQRAGLLVDSRLTQAVQAVPRHALLPQDLADRAYTDTPLTLGATSFEPSPVVQVAMVQAARVGPGQYVLDLEPGIGYRAALCARMGARVLCLVGSPNLKQELESAMQKLDLAGVKVDLGDPAGMAKYGPYNVVFGCWSSREVPETMADQLRNQGRMVLLPSAGRDRIEVLRNQKGTLSLVETLQIAQLSQAFSQAATESAQ